MYFIISHLPIMNVPLVSHHFWVSATANPPKSYKIHILKSVPILGALLKNWVAEGTAFKVNYLNPKPLKFFASVWSVRIHIVYVVYFSTMPHLKYVVTKLYVSTFHQPHSLYQSKKICMNSRIINSFKLSSFSSISSI